MSKVCIFSNKLTFHHDLNHDLCSFVSASCNLLTSKHVRKYKLFVRCFTCVRDSFQTGFFEAQSSGLIGQWIKPIIVEKLHWSQAGLETCCNSGVPTLKAELTIKLLKFILKHFLLTVSFPKKLGFLFFFCKSFILAN